MSSFDLIFITNWWLMLFGIGVLFLPITANIFKNFPDRGYIFSKILGIASISYLIFALGTLKLFPFTNQTILLVMGLFIGINILVLRKYWRVTIEQYSNQTIILAFFEETFFTIALFFWSYVRVHAPDIHGLEKYMDFGFVNSILRTEYFPPPDMWYNPKPINYYYFGHLETAVLTKLSGIPSNITFNLMLATLFAFAFACAFSIGFNLFTLKKRVASQTGLPAEALAKAGPGAVAAGLLTAFLVSLSGNLHTIYAFFHPYLNDNPVPISQLKFALQTFPNSYWYPNATRFIHNTIHEFPIYSFVVSDLHGHVLDIPIVLTIIAVLLSLIFKFQISNFKFQIILLSFLLAIAYMTNAWDGFIYLLLTCCVIAYLIIIQNKNSILDTAYILFFLVGGFALFSIPFSLYFEPSAIVKGFGVLCAPEFLTKIQKLGPFLFETDHCQRSPLWQLGILYGFFYFWVIIFLKHLKLLASLRSGKIENFSKADIFILILITLSTFLILIPEFFYLKDIYPAHYRANTMFKLTYQAFIMLSISSGYIIVKTISNLKNQISNIFNFVFFIFAILFLILVSIYPYFAINSYYGNLSLYVGLDGTRYLKKQSPSDYAGVLWLNKNAYKNDIILEAQGESYTDYARVSSNTGIPTVIGWPVHEWLWRGSYDVASPRIADVGILYESLDINQTKTLLNKYHVTLVFVGDLERQKYTNLYEAKFNTIGTIVFEQGFTKIYRPYSRNNRHP